MYSVETAKMSSKGQLVIPDALRKRYGWQPGTTLLMIGTGDAIVLQALQTPSDETIDSVLAESKAAGDSVSHRIANAKAALSKLGKLGIRLPNGIEKSESRRSMLLEKHS